MTRRNFSFWNCFVIRCFLLCKWKLGNVNQKVGAELLKKIELNLFKYKTEVFKVKYSFKKGKVILPTTKPPNCIFFPK